VIPDTKISKPPEIINAGSMPKFDETMPQVRKLSKEPSRVKLEAIPITPPLLLIGARLLSAV
jgi:hypothetical protein